MIVCPNCSGSNPDNARFCLNCGTALASTALREEERKLVTVVFAELLGFRRATGEFDPEDLKRVLEPYHARIARVVANHGGTVDSPSDRRNAPWRIASSSRRPMNGLVDSGRTSTP